MQEYLLIGSVLKPQGIRGESKIKPYAARMDMFPVWTTLYRKAGEDYLPLSSRVTRIHEGFVYAVLDGCTSADEAEKLRGLDLYIDRAHAFPPGEDANLIADLIGCEAVDEQGSHLGRLTDVLQYGSVDTWVFQTPGGTLMAPALKAVLPAVHPEEGIIDVVRERLEEVAVRED